MARNWYDEARRQQREKSVPARDLGAAGDVVNERRERPGENLPPRGSQTVHTDADRPEVRTVPRSIGGHVRPVAAVVAQRNNVRGA